MQQSKPGRRKQPLVDPEVTILSYPKSGRTWLAFLVTGYISRLYGNPSIVAPIKDGRLSTLKPERRPSYNRLVLDNRVEGNWAPTVSFAHLATLGTPFFAAKPRAELRGALVLLLRDPRDVVVSHYHHVMSRHGGYPFSNPGPRLPESYRLSEFIRSEHFGIRHILRYVADWSHIAAESVRPVVYYEDFVSDARGALASLLAAIGVTKIDPDLLGSSVDAASFERLSASEGKADQSAKRFRKGVVGGHASELSAPDRAYLDEMLTEADIPSLRRYVGR
jgi:hypothetical protein